jgi:hypothetical protein
MPQVKFKDPETEYIYTDIGLRDLALKWGINKNTLMNRSWNQGWTEKRKRFKQRVRAKTEDKVIDTMAEMNIRHIKMYKILQAKSLTALSKTDITRATDAGELLDKAIRGERQILGILGGMIPDGKGGLSAPGTVLNLFNATMDRLSMVAEEITKSGKKDEILAGLRRLKDVIDQEPQSEIPTEAMDGQTPTGVETEGVTNGESGTTEKVADLSDEPGTADDPDGEIKKVLQKEGDDKVIS